jgi:Asp-tRNA(Asn)/Glu-tRNA(Gln) amidotransferase A subunit family amidase
LSDKPCFLPIAEASRRIAARVVSPIALTKAHLARIATIDGQLNAYVTGTRGLALQQRKRQSRNYSVDRIAGRTLRHTLWQ